MRAPLQRLLSEGHLTIFIAREGQLKQLIWPSSLQNICEQKLALQQPSGCFHGLPILRNHFLNFLRYGRFREFLFTPTSQPPGRILGYHAYIQIPHFLGDPLPSDIGCWREKPIPIEPEAGSMPADDRLRSDDYQNLLPFRPHPADGNPQEAIKSSRLRPWLPPLQSHKLLPQDQIFQ
jgi:hypothetical protein